ncbi:hypothetical protein GGR57DRAFT_371385 [Xylariaceae sp. FL1272]|nr:hypothetical protein GGR57DRAFT_371385 [Xylariaceae sp. FL1272]
MLYIQFTSLRWTLCRPCVACSLRCCECSTAVARCRFSVLLRSVMAPVCLHPSLARVVAEWRGASRQITANAMQSNLNSVQACRLSPVAYRTRDSARRRGWICNGLPLVQGAPLACRQLERGASSDLLLEGGCAGGDHCSDQEPLAGNDGQAISSSGWMGNWCGTWVRRRLRLRCTAYLTLRNRHILKGNVCPGKASFVCLVIRLQFDIACHCVSTYVPI